MIAMGKITFRVTLVISVLMIAFLLGLQTVFVEADPFVVLAPPVIRIGSADGVIYSESTVTIPYWVEVYPMGIEISDFRCSFDGKLLETSVPVSPKSLFLTGLSDGNHTISVALTAKTTLTSNSHLGVYWTTKEVSESVTFTVDTTAPSFTVPPWQNMTFNTTEVSLNFTIDESVNEVFYCLDGKGNVTFDGNLNITQIYGKETYCAVFGNLEEGSHNLTLYAKDAAGHTGESETYYFTVNTQPTPTPTPSTNPSPSPTQQPTQEPTSEPTTTPSPKTDNVLSADFTPAILGGIAAVAAAVGGLIYSKRRKRS